MTMNNHVNQAKISHLVYLFQNEVDLRQKEQPNASYLLDTCHMMSPNKSRAKLIENVRNSKFSKISKIEMEKFEIEVQTRINVK